VSTPAKLILEVNSVSKSFQTGGTAINVLKEASLQLRSGQITGIIGPSGSGKTTMLMIAGLLEVPDIGEVRFDGRCVSSPRAKLEQLRDLRRKHIGFVFQKANLIPFLNARDNVAVTLEIAGKKPRVARTMAAEILGSLGLENRLSSLPQQLSGGEQQRVAIARAFANDPVVLFADEPTAALDPVRAQQVMDLFLSLSNARKTAVCVVSHDLRWESYAHEVVAFENGRTQVRPGLAFGETLSGISTCETNRVT